MFPSGRAGSRTPDLKDRSSGAKADVLPARHGRGSVGKDLKDRSRWSRLGWGGFEGPLPRLGWEGLFFAKRGHGIDARRAAGRKRGGSSGNHGENCKRQSGGQWICRLQVKQGVLQ